MFDEKQVEQIKAMFKRLAEVAEKVIDNLKRIFGIFEEIEKTKKIRQSWRVPMKIHMRSQVINRKPIRVIARANL